MAMMESVPTQITIDSTFSAIQQQDITRAIGEWNAYASGKYGRNLFRANVGLVPPAFTSSDSRALVDPRDCGKSFGSPNSFYIVREQSNTQWSSLRLTTNNPGATFQCEASTDLSEVNAVIQQVVYINTNVTTAFQLNSVIVHELGHAAGLDHSCTKESGRSDYASCDGLGSDHPYRQAVMFPTLAPSETKEVLRSNDKERADCLYNIQ